MSTLSMTDIPDVGHGKRNHLCISALCESNWTGISSLSLCFATCLATIFSLNALSIQPGPSKLFITLSTSKEHGCVLNKCTKMYPNKRVTEQKYSIHRLHKVVTLSHGVCWWF